jgi:CRISPR/Cas system-associated exonuclease Cas4 (RecB family)
MGEFTFDAEKHEYRIDGKILPSITQILKDEGFIDSTWYNVAARDKGTMVHLLTHLWDVDELWDLDQVTNENRPYLEAYTAFLKENCVEITQSERPMWHPSGYAGTPDKAAFFRENGERAVIEIKTGSKAPWHPLQTAAQAILLKHLCPEYTLLDRYALYLSPNGYKLEQHKDRADYTMWKSILAVHNWKKGK